MKKLLEDSQAIHGQKEGNIEPALPRVYMGNLSAGVSRRQDTTSQLTDNY